MAKKKAKKPVKNEDANEVKKGFFSRHSDVIPEKENTRVQTVIVDKPIIIHDRPRHIYSGREESFDAEESRYHKRKKRGAVEDVVEEDYVSEEDFGQDAGDESGFSEGEAGGDSMAAEDDMESFDENIENEVKRRHPRSRGLFSNVWWKKAIIWGVLVWLLILVLEIAMQAIGLVEVDLRRQWWFLLGGLVVAAMIYFGVIESRLKI